MSHSKKNNKPCQCDLCNSKSFFSGKSLIETNELLDNLNFGGTLHYDPTRQKWLVESSMSNIIDVLKNEAIRKRFEDMEFALDEEGRPDGLKNYQEMVFTIAGDIADSINELAFEEAKRELERGDLLNEQAMKLLKESKEK